MPLNTQKTNSAVNAEANALAPLFNSGFLDIYSGTQPATGDTAIGAQVLLASLTFNATAFPAAVAGVLTANAITNGTGTAGAGAGTTATWFRAFQSNHTTAILDGSVGTATSNLILNTTTISTGLTVSCSSYVHTVAKSTAGF